MADNSSDIKSMVAASLVNDAPSVQGIFAICAVMLGKGMLNEGDVGSICQAMEDAVVTVSGAGAAHADDARALIRRRRKLLLGEE